MKHQDPLRISEDGSSNDVRIYMKDSIGGYPLWKSNSRSKHLCHRHRIHNVCWYVDVVVIRRKLELTCNRSPHPANTSHSISDPKLLACFPIFNPNP